MSLLVLFPPQPSQVRTMSPSGLVTTFAGSGSTTYADGASTAAGIYRPRGLAIDSQGYLYLGDNLYIRKIAPTGVVTTLAGSGSATITDGYGTSASFYNPTGIAVDTRGLVYVADQSNHVVRVISPAGYASTLAGTGSANYVDGTGTFAKFYNPIGVGVDSNGNVYETDSTYGVIRKISQTGAHFNDAARDRFHLSVCTLSLFSITGLSYLLLVR